MAATAGEIRAFVHPVAMLTTTAAPAVFTVTIGN